MGDLTEAEIFSAMSDNLKGAAQDADDLARLPAKGPTYDRLRKKLRLIEGCCRQASAWREDTRWLPIGRLMAECHQKAGGALRGVKMRDGTRVKLTAGQLHPFFLMLAQNLRDLFAHVERLRTAKTGRVGMILPRPLPAPHRDSRPVGWDSSLVRRPSGLIVPASPTVQ